MGPDPRTEYWATDDRAFLWRVRTVDRGLYVDRWTADGWRPSLDGGYWYLRMRAIGSPDDRDRITPTEAAHLMSRRS